MMRSGSIRVAAYIRVSADSHDQENSYETQDKYFTELLSQNPAWISAGVYSDYGISGTSQAKRTGYTRLLRHCRNGRIDRIVCKSISRFTRNTSDFMKALDILHEAHVTILFEKEGLDTADPTSDFILTTLAAIAQEESRAISSNIRWGIQKRYPKGHVRNYNIYGYRFAKGEHAIEMTEDGYPVRQVEIVPEEAEVVRRIFQAVENGEQFADIARALNYEHIKAPDYGKKKRKIRGRTTVKDGIETGWTAAMVSRFIRLERYCGDVILQKTYTPDFLTHKSIKNDGVLPQYRVLDHHPAIISREQFERVQDAVRYNSVRYANRTDADHKKTYPFSGRLICAHCGRAYNVRNTDRYPIWFCPTAALNNGKYVCHAEKIYEEQIVRMFRKAFTDRFQLLTEAVADDIHVTDIMSGRYEEAEITFPFDRQTDSFVEQMRRRLRNIQKMDFIERDRAFLKRQLESLQIMITETSCTSRKLIASEEIRIQEAKAEKAILEQQLNSLEKYWEQLEASYEDREKALEWMRTLPDGKEGTTAFLNGLTDIYVKAFALSIKVHDPLHYTVHWFDDTRTKVEMYSNVKDYRCTAAYFDGQIMKEKYRRKG